MSGLTAENLNKLAEETEVIATAEVNTPVGKREIELSWSTRTGVWAVATANERGFCTGVTRFPPSVANTEDKATKEFLGEIRYQLTGRY